MIILENEELVLSVENERVYITVKSPGYTLKKFEELTKNYPRLKVSNFMALKKAVDNKTAEAVEIGSWIDSVEIETSADCMQVLLTIYNSKKYVQDNLFEIQSKIQELLIESNITYGLKSIDLQNLITGKSYIIAEGLPPKKGEDAKITYLKQAEKKPVIKADGKADYFDMSFIVEIEEGSWLGEKIPAKEGIEGINIFGEAVPASRGADATLKYDPKSTYEVEEDEKIVLRSRTNGVIGNINGLFSVQKHLIVEGDVGIVTGNLNFDGSIQIKGTVMPGYSVIASGDISVEANEGVNAAELIKSTEGDVFIKGGIFGRDVTKVEALKNIYIKHANACMLEAGEKVFIGFYTLGSLVIGKEVSLDERKGKIIGGKVIAVNSITAAYCGNSLERKTELIVQGINREILTGNVKEKAEEMMKLQNEIPKLSLQIDQLNKLKNSMNSKQNAVYEQTKQKFNGLQNEVKALDKDMQRILSLLREKQEYFIQITKEANAGTIIQIGNKSVLMFKKSCGKFQLENGELNV